jgi:hypothetical protein
LRADEEEETATEEDEDEDGVDDGAGAFPAGLLGVDFCFLRRGDTTLAAAAAIAEPMRRPSVTAVEDVRRSDGASIIDNGSAVSLAVTVAEEEDE